MEQVSRQRVQDLLADGAVAVEALGQEHHASGHLPGAVNLPLEALDRAADVLPDKDASVVVYCADASCPNSTIAAERLVELGYRKVYEYVDGKKDWVEAGLALEAPEVAS